MKTVLVADDEAAIRRIYEDELRDHGYNVVTATTAAEAIEAARSGPCDLIIMDIRMPGMSGVEAMNRILEENNELPIVISSACGSYHESFLTWPADAYLTKSADLGELVDTVNSLIGDDNDLDCGAPSLEGDAAESAARKALTEEIA